MKRAILILFVAMFGCEPDLPRRYASYDQQIEIVGTEPVETPQAVEPAPQVVTPLEPAATPPANEAPDAFSIEQEIQRLKEQMAANEAELASTQVTIHETFAPASLHGKKIVEAFTAKVIGISDGDTIKVLGPDNSQIKVRLESIDTPERKQPFGEAAKKATSELCFGKTVSIYKTGEDRWKRTLAFVFVDGVDVSAELVRRGLAWNYIAYSKSTELAKIETVARDAKVGLWSASETPIAPWAWRKAKR